MGYVGFTDWQGNPLPTNSFYNDPALPAKTGYTFKDDNGKLWHNVSDDAHGFAPSVHEDKIAIYYDFVYAQNIPFHVKEQKGGGGLFGGTFGRVLTGIVTGGSSEIVRAASGGKIDYQKIAGSALEKVQADPLKAVAAVGASVASGNPSAALPFFLSNSVGGAPKAAPTFPAVMPSTMPTLVATPVENQVPLGLMAAGAGLILGALLFL